MLFPDPEPCGSWINIGQIIEGVPNQAMVSFTEIPFTALRTFYINCASLGLSIIWYITCFGLMSEKFFNYSGLYFSAFIPLCAYYVDNEAFFGYKLFQIVSKKLTIRGLYRSFSHGWVSRSV